MGEYQLNFTLYVKVHASFAHPYSFLFGTCCLLSGEIETSLANVKSNASSHVLTEMASTKQPALGSSKPQVINNQFYGANADDDNSLYEDTKFEVSNDAVVVSSPAYGEKISSAYYPTEATKKTSQSVASQSYSTELPTRIYSTMMSTSSEEANDLSNSIQFSQLPYDHSDISYSPSDAEVLMENDDNLMSQYPPISTPETLFTETRTEASEKQKFTKPIFKLKPTQHPTSTEKYVLVHTISNDKQNEVNQQNPTKKPSTNESIQSIILMLNGSNSGPEYSVESTNVNNNYNSESASTPAYGSTTMINREKYGSSSYYITTKSPSKRPTTLNVPSTSYVYSPNPTRRQTSKTTTKKIINRVKITPTRSPQRPTALNVPSTSYVYSPNPITRRPTTPASSTVSPSTTMKKETASVTKMTTPKPSIIVKQPSPGDVESNYVVISGGGITKHPSPTVHITPKPITNILTSTTMNQVNNKQTKKPLGENSPTPSPTSSPVTEHPPFYSSTPGTFISSSIYVPAIQDFHNEGYFVVTHRPASGVSSTAVYTINPGSLNAHPLIDGNIKIPNDPVNLNDDVPVINNNDDFSNFPPVRNPNLNMTATNIVMDESEISTPSFVQDEQLNSKIDLLVNKLVASMQGNLDNLIDIVYERKNVTSAELAISNLNKNGTISESAKPTKAPSKVTTSKAPSRVTTGRPSLQTTKKTQTKAPTTSKKPATVNRKTTPKPTLSSQTTRRPPSRLTTVVTKKPTRKVTTTSTTARAPAEDELLEGEEEESEGEATAEEETVEENEGEETVVEESEDVDTSPPVESGRIRKKIS